MDPTNFYHLGQIMHQERLQAAEAYYLSKTLNREPTLWQRLIAQLGTRLAKVTAAHSETGWAYRDVVTD